MFHAVYVEKNILKHPRVLSILQSLGNPTILEIDSFDDWWGKAKKPYLQKRTKLNLFLAEKKGTRVKLAPDAYGQKGDPHYYFVHSYNCIYECQYCYLQGYFSTPDIVWFINHEDIISDMKEILKLSQSYHVWFHAGEFSDSLALSHLTQELEVYHQFVESEPRVLFELRTKSVNIRSLKKLKPLQNYYISFSLSPEKASLNYDLKTPKTSLRLKAMEELIHQGFKVAAHFDPMIYSLNYEKEYGALLEEMVNKGILKELEYLSLGVVRFTKDVYREVEKNYPESQLLNQQFITPPDGKKRYPRVVRETLLNQVKKMAMESGLEENKIYLCMENETAG